VFRAIVLHHVCRVGLLEKLGCTFRLNRSTRKHSNGRCAAVDAVGEKFGELLLVLASQQCSKVLDAFGMRRISRLDAGAAELAGGREMDAIGREAIADQHHAHAISCIVVVEHRK
jgi:hypothetical protein